MNELETHRSAEAWLWGLVAPVPALIAAATVASSVTSVLGAVQPGFAVAVALLVLVGRLAHKRHPTCAYAFAAGTALLLVALGGFVLWVLSTLQFG